MFEDTPLWMVNDRKALEQVAEKLATADAIGVDTESDSFYSYREKVCLLQISDLENDYIIDPLAFDDLSVLAPIMADERITKIFHGADYDVVSLKRDYDWKIHNIFDTMVSAQLLGMPKLGLADLIGRFFGIEIEKKYQRHDWSQRPLKPEHIEYARGDSHWLPALRRILTRNLRHRQRFAHVQEECTLLEQRTWTPRPFDDNGYLYIKGASRLDDAGLRVLRRLYLYRDRQAQAMDRPTFKVISDRDLVAVATTLPTSRGALDKALPGKHGLKRRHADALVEAVNSGLEDDFSIPAPDKQRKKKKPTTANPRLRGQQADQTYEALKSWRNALLDRHENLTSAAVVSNGILREIARVRPLTLDQLRAIPEVRNWQVGDFGERLLSILDEVAPWTDTKEATFQQKKRKK